MGKKKVNKAVLLGKLISRYRTVFVLDLERQRERKRSLLRRRFPSFGAAGCFFIGKNSTMKRLMIEHTEAHPTSALVALVPYIYGETGLLFTSEHWEMVDDILRTEFYLAPRAAVLEGSHGLLTGTELQEYWERKIPSSRERDAGALAAEVVNQSSTGFEVVNQLLATGFEVVNQLATGSELSAYGEEEEWEGLEDLTSDWISDVIDMTSEELEDWFEELEG